MIHDLEFERLSIIEDRDGKESALKFAKECIKIYRACVLHSRKRGYVRPHFGSTPLYRRKFIISYLSFKRYMSCQN